MGLDKNMAFLVLLSFFREAAVARFLKQLGFYVFVRVSVFGYLPLL